MFRMRLNFMWIYAAIGLFIIGSWLLGEDRETPVKGDWTMVERMVREGDVAQIRVLNREQAEVFLKEGAAEKYRADSTDLRLKNLPPRGAQVLFTIGSVG